MFPDGLTAAHPKGRGELRDQPRTARRPDANGTWQDRPPPPRPQIVPTALTHPKGAGNCATSPGQPAARHTPHTAERTAPAETADRADGAHPPQGRGELRDQPRT
ncbi:hypothetical protein ACWEHT_15620, partial [Streptomyces sp. NPDC004646]